MNGHVQTCTAGPGCSKLTMSLLNVSLKIQMLIHVPIFPPIFFSVFGYEAVKPLTSLPLNELVKLKLMML